MKIPACTALLAASSAIMANGALIAGFDFQTTTTGGTAAAASPSPLVYDANFGTATLYLDGTNGSSTFTTGVSNPEVTAFAGSNVNTAGTDLSTTTSGAASLAIANSSANEKRAVFVLSLAAIIDPEEYLGISYSTQRTATGFTSHEWSYSTDGIVWETFDTQTWPGGTGSATTFSGVGVVTLNTSSLSVLNGEGTVYIGLTFDGATAAAGNNRLDNIQFNVVPEPTAALLGALGLLGILRRRR